MLLCEIEILWIKSFLFDINSQTKFHILLNRSFMFMELQFEFEFGFTYIEIRRRGSATWRDILSMLLSLAYEIFRGLIFTFFFRKAASIRTLRCWPELLYNIKVNVVHELLGVMNRLNNQLSTVYDQSICGDVTYQEY